MNSKYAVLLLLFCLAGCTASSNEEKETAVVSGWVTIDGKSTKGILLDFHSPSGSQSFAAGEGGGYQASNLLPGSYKITLKSPGAGSGRSKAGGDMKLDESKKSIAVPKRYQDPISSGFEVTVVAGETKTLDLKMSN